MKKILLLMMATMFVVTSCSGQTNKNQKASEVGTVKLTKADFLKKVYDFEASANGLKYLGDKPAIVDFYADWCPPCRQIAPILEELAKEYKGQINIYKVDVDKETELSAAFNVESLPTLLFIPMNGEPQMLVGGRSKADFKKAIDSVLLGKTEGAK